MSDALRDANRYFDPRSGEPLTRDQFMQRYGATAFAHVARPAMAATGTSDAPGLPSLGATCGGCGSAVAKKGDLCETCVEKPQYAAPKFARTLGEQPEPAYVRERRLAQQAQDVGVEETSGDVPAGTVIGGASHDGH